MSEFLSIFAPLSAAATGALVSAMWEGAILVALVALCLRLLPGLSAAARSIIWLNLFILLALLHVLPVVAHESPQLPPVPAVHADPRWSLAVAALWLALSLWRAAQLVIGAIHLHRLVRRAVPVAVDPAVQAILNDAPAGRSARLCTSAEIARPSVLGFFHPRILVPPALIRELSPGELQQVLLHEMEHLRRADDWTNLLQKIGLVLFPLNPALLWVERRLCAERELACDDRVVRAGSGRKAYALCLTRLAELSMLQRGFSLVLGAFERRPELVNRVHRILSRPAQRMGRRAALLTSAGLLSGALACALVLARSPQLVSFAPAVPSFSQPAVLAPLDMREVSRALGGTPQRVKAVLPQRIEAHPVRKAVLRRAVRRNPAPDRLAVLAPQGGQGRPSLLVMTEWSGFDPAPRVVISVLQEQHAPAAIAVQTAFAVQTANGWLILQI